MIGPLTLFLFPFIANLTPASKYLQNLFVMGKDTLDKLNLTALALTALVITITLLT